MTVGLIPALQARGGLGDACPLPGNHPVIVLMIKRAAYRERRQWSPPLRTEPHDIGPQLSPPTRFKTPKAAFDVRAQAKLALAQIERRGPRAPWYGELMGRPPT